MSVFAVKMTPTLEYGLQQTAPVSTNAGIASVSRRQWSERKRRMAHTHKKEQRVSVKKHESSKVIVPR